MNILIISPSYAPYSGVGSIRMVSLTKYLVEAGHSITVVKTSPELWPKESLKSKIPEGINTIDVYAKGNFKDCMNAFLETVEKVLINNKIDISIYSCNPYYIAPVAVFMKKKYDAKYIIEFRDLWIKDEFVTRNWLKRIKKILVRIPYRAEEKRVISHSNAVVTVAPSDTKTLVKDYPENKNKIFTIFNGYDEKRINDTEFKLSVPTYPYIAVFGKFGYYDFKYVLEMLKTIKRLWDKGIKIKILHIGPTDENTQKAIDKIKLPMEAYVNTGYLDYAKGIKLLENAFASCLIVHYKNAIGTKIFDYIYANKPVIYFAHKDSAIAEILNGCKHAYRCKNSADVLNAVDIIYHGNITSLECIEKSQYSRSIQNERYLELIHRVVWEYDNN